MGRPKKDKTEESKITGEIRFGIPPAAGGAEYVTLLVESSMEDRGILQASPLGYIAKEVGIKKEEERRREMTEEELETAIQNKVEKAVLLPSEIAAQLAYPTGDGRYYHPAAAFISAVIDAFWASKAVFIGMREGAQFVIERNVKNVTDQVILFDPATKKPFMDKRGKPPYSIHVCTGVNRNAGKRIVLFRPHWRRWAAFVTFRYNTGLITPKLLQQGMVIAGQQVGIGAFRLLPPQNVDIKMRGRGGPFGGWTSTKIWTKAVPKDLQPLL